MIGPATTTPIALQARASQRAHGQLRLWLLCIASAILPITAAMDLLSLQGIAVIASVLQLVTAYAIVRSGERAVSVSSAFAVLWMAYFPLRLLVITFGGPSPYYFPAVDAASPEQLTTVWLTTTAAIVLWLLGRHLASRVLHSAGSVDKIDLPYRRFVGIGIAALGITAVLFALQLSSGILGNIGELVLFAIAGTAYQEVETRRLPYVSTLLVFSGMAFGYANGFKELMLLPVVAWIIGRAGAGKRLRLRTSPWSSSWPPCWPSASFRASALRLTPDARFKTPSRHFSWDLAL